MVLAQVEAARAEMAERVGLRRGRAAIGTPPTVGTQLLPKALADFNQQYPGIEFRLHEAGVQTLLDLLEAGLADMAVVTLPVDDSNLMVAELFGEELVVVARNTHWLASQSSVTLDALRNEGWLLSPKSYELRETTLHACHQAGFAPRVVLDGGEMDTLLHLVAAGVGITLVPRLAVPHDNNLVMVQIAGQNLRRSLGLVWRNDRVASPAARALREFLVEHLRLEYNEYALTH
jgi:DNA-binding transcriptional LysR family regulator